MNRRTFLRWVGTGAAGLWAAGRTATAPARAAQASAPAAARLPNIVFILADDIGYGDLGCYGATKVKTPNCDRLAAEGVRFTDAHSPSSMCSPTRYAFLTGQYAWRNPAVARGVLSGVSPLSIRKDTLTVPALLKQAGYATGIVGKWHLGLGNGATEYNGDIKPGPLEVGFDYAFFYPATNDRVPGVFVENHRVVGLDPKDPIRISYGEKVGDEPTGKENPDLLKLKHSHGHDNTIVNGIGRIGFMAGGKAARWVDEDVADVFAGKAVAFLEKQAKDKPFFLYLPTADIHVPRTPNARFRGTSQCGVRGDAIHEFDWTVGQIASTLARLGLAENTLVIVTSDNGGVIDDGYADGAPQDLGDHRLNGVLRGFKGGLYEGGHRVPFMARWPGRIKPATTSAETVALVDMLATCAAITGRDLPADAGPDSFNILPSLVGEKADKPVRPNLVHHAGGGGLSIRQGPWKLIPGRGAGGAAKAKAKADPTKPFRDPGGAGGDELYNLADDLSETKNLAAANPEKVAELKALLATVRDGGRSRA